MRKRGAAALLLLLASCGGEAPEADRKADLPLPSGPPIAQQLDAEPAPAPKPSSALWRIATSGEGTALQLAEPGGKLLLGIACTGSPRQLVVTVPRFSTIGSEDRFSLGLGNDPLVLVADLASRPPGVVAQSPAPSDIGERLQRAAEITALYGTQRIGPVPAPSGALKDALAKACIYP